jgi:hypothetical protein
MVPLHFSLGASIMKTIQIFYQREGAAGVEHLEFPSDRPLAEVLRTIAAKHGGGADLVLFLEECDEPAELSTETGKEAKSGSLKVHVHRCRHIDVAVTFNNRTVKHDFAPSATIARIKRWAAEKQFGMTPEEAGEHALQLVAAGERPAPGVHVGSLASHPASRVAFDLVPNERENGPYADSVQR